MQPWAVSSVYQPRASTKMDALSREVGWVGRGLASTNITGWDEANTDDPGTARFTGSEGSKAKNARKVARESAEASKSLEINKKARQLITFHIFHTGRHSFFEFDFRLTSRIAVGFVMPDG